MIIFKLKVLPPESPLSRRPTSTSLICYALVTGEDELWIRLLLKRTTEEVEKAQLELKTAERVCPYLKCPHC